jgi:hypothetical protein
MEVAVWMCLFHHPGPDLSVQQCSTVQQYISFIPTKNMPIFFRNLVAPTSTTAAQMWSRKSEIESTFLTVSARRSLAATSGVLGRQPRTISASINPSFHDLNFRCAQMEEVSEEGDMPPTVLWSHPAAMSRTALLPAGSALEEAIR